MSDDELAELDAELVELLDALLVLFELVELLDRLLAELLDDRLDELDELAEELVSSSSNITDSIVVPRSRRASSK